MVSENESEIKALIIKLYEIGAFKFGDFKMKVGINSPVYFDLRVIISYPDIMNSLSKLLGDLMDEKKFALKHICGVPYTALPIATLVSVQKSIPMLIRRKEAKSYGTKKLIEGNYCKGDTCLIIEDVITSGSSVIETVKDLEREGIVVTDAIVVVDREQGGKANISKHSIRTHSLFTLSQLLNTLKEAGKIKHDVVDSVANYIQNSQIDYSSNSIDLTVAKKLKRGKLTFESRANLAKCELARDLFTLMAVKKTNLCLAADITKCEELLNVADSCGPYICILKTHIDIIDDFNTNFLNDLAIISKKHNFFLMEDRKYADIGNTVSRQYSNGIFKISEWADFVTVHSLPGPSILSGLKKGLCDNSKKRAVFLLAEMSTQNNLVDTNYKEATMRLATEGPDSDFVAGIVCQNSDCFDFPGLIQLTPGIKIDDLGDKMGQQYNSPEYAVGEECADVCVVGRGILEAKSIEKAAILYRDRLWAAYIDRLSDN